MKEAGSLRSAVAVAKVEVVELDQEHFVSLKRCSYSTDVGRASVLGGLLEFPPGCLSEPRGGK
jgi:hypothetical protein